MTAAARGAVDVLTYHNDNGRTGQNLSETILTPANVNAGSFGKLFTYPVDGDVYAQPLYVSSLNVPGLGVHNAVIVATENNSVYAFNADSDSGTRGGLLWHANLGTAARTPTPDFGNRYGGFTQITPQVGITGTPVIDLATMTLYVDTFEHTASNYIHRMHALNIETGKERSYSPVIVSAAIRGAGVGGSNGMVRFEAMQQLQRAALTLSDGIVYVPYCGYADSDPYHGWILGYNASNLKLTTNNIFNTTPNSVNTDTNGDAGEAGIWMGGCGLAVDASGDLYFATGNGSFDAYNGTNGTEYGDSFIKLSTAHHLQVADYFTPYNQAYMADNDLDIGSGGILLLPNQPGQTPHLMLAGGKLGTMYLLNRDAFTEGNNHYNAGGTSDAVLQTVAMNGGHFDTPAYFNGSVYVTAANDSLSSFAVADGMLNLPATSVANRILPFPGATPSVSAYGGMDGIIWIIQYGNPATLVADAATNVSAELYNSDEAGSRDQLGEGTKFAVPTVANGKVYVGGRGTLSVFGLLGTVSTNYPPSGTYNGLFYSTNAVEIGQSGYLSVVVNTKADYSGRMTLGSKVYSFSGKFDASGAAYNAVNVAGQDPVQIQLQFTANNPEQLAGTVGNDVWTAQALAAESTYNTRTNPCRYAGRYNVVIHGPGNGNALEPQGDGYGIVTIGGAGGLVFEGTLADGTPVSQTTTISDAGQWALYSSMYTGQGELIGWLSFTNASASGLSGKLVWTKSPIPKASAYKEGFSQSAALEGSPFKAGTTKSPLLTFGFGQLVLSGAGLAENATNDFSVAASERIEAAKGITINFALSSGVFRGSVPNPAGGHDLSFIGIFLPDQDCGYGYFLNNGLSGEVYFGPQ